MSNFATNLKRIREECGLTQVVLADLIGIRQSYISAWKLGNREPLTPSVIAIAKALNVSADKLLGINDNCTHKLSKGVFSLSRIFCDQDCYECVRLAITGYQFEHLVQEMLSGFSGDGYKEVELHLRSDMLDSLTKT